MGCFGLLLISGNVGDDFHVLGLLNNEEEVFDLIYLFLEWVVSRRKFGLKFWKYSDFRGSGN